MVTGGSARSDTLETPIPALAPTQRAAHVIDRSDRATFFLSFLLILIFSFIPSAGLVLSHMFLRRAAVVVGSGAAGFTLGHPIHPDTPLSAPPPPRQPQSRRTVHLASSVWTPGIPTTVLIHGLDSSRETWRGTLGFCQANGLPAVALDLRGHGESPLGPFLSSF